MNIHLIAVVFTWSLGGSKKLSFTPRPKVHGFAQKQKVNKPNLHFGIVNEGWNIAFFYCRPIANPIIFDETMGEITLFPDVVFRKSEGLGVMGKDNYSIP